MATEIVKIGLSGLARRHYLVLVLSALLTACGHNEVCDPPSAHSLVVFGDSYSDTGNIVDLPWPFHNGRFSNGLVAVDHLAAHMTTVAQPSKHIRRSCPVGFNYAVGGGNILGSKPQDLMCQIDSYLDRMSNSAAPGALFLVIMGGNDVRSLSADLSDSEADDQIDEIVTHLFDQLERLAAAGAVKFMIANSGDMGLLPGSLADQNPNLSPRLTEYSVKYNDQFNAQLGAFIDNQAVGVEVTMFDLANVMVDVITNPMHDFENTTEACFDVDGPTFHADCMMGPNPLVDRDVAFDEFVFFDSVHASARAQELIGQALINALP